MGADKVAPPRCAHSVSDDPALIAAGLGKVALIGSLATSKTVAAPSARTVTPIRQHITDALAHDATAAVGGLDTVTGDHDAALGPDRAPPARCFVLGGERPSGGHLSWQCRPG